MLCTKEKKWTHGHWSSSHRWKKSHWRSIQYCSMTLWKECCVTHQIIKCPSSQKCLALISTMKSMCVMSEILLTFSHSHSHLFSDFQQTAGHQATYCASLHSTQCIIRSTVRIEHQAGAAAAVWELIGPADVVEPGAIKPQPLVLEEKHKIKVSCDR